MKNERGAGRKPIISEAELKTIRNRIQRGEKVSVIASEFGITRQALYKRLQQDEVKTVHIDYMVDGICATHIEVDFAREAVHILNYAEKISERAFGLKENPDWDDFISLIEREYLRSIGFEPEAGVKMVLCRDVPEDSYTMDDLTHFENTHLKISGNNNDIVNLPKFYFDKSDILFSRADTDGFQLKAISKDRKWFVKAQAIISGVRMDDWAVELIASDLCEQLGISHVKQRPCVFHYADVTLHAVYSANFELDGYQFISFESLLHRMGLSSQEEEFIRLDAISKMKWCAEKLAAAGNLEYEAALKYMRDLALLDCLVGNVDRHTRNFGLFYHLQTGKYEIPLLFDNGMGLFEHDSYKEHYRDYDSAMRNVYVSPYGEDPFDMVKYLCKEFDMHALYPGLESLEYRSIWMTPFAKEYTERMSRIWRK